MLLTTNLSSHQQKKQPKTQPYLRLQRMVEKERTSDKNVKYMEKKQPLRKAESKDNQTKPMNPENVNQKTNSL